MSETGSPREVVIVVFDDFQLLDLAGPAEVFDVAGRLVADAYRVRIASLGGADTVCTSGTRIGVDTDLAAITDPPHTLLVVGGLGYLQAAEDQRLLAHLRRLAAGAQRVASVCTGAFVLAAAGLLEGKRATTHWSRCEELALEHPDVAVEPDAIFVRDGGVVTSAGVTAGTDLALALVEEDHGADIARGIGRWLVVFLRRPGGQSQFSAWTQTRRVGDAAVRDLLDHIEAHPDADLSVPAMARYTAMSERNFTRRFTKETGVPPGRYVEQARVRAARVLLESGAEAVESVARICGFGSGETMRRAFVREIGVPPGAYRERFHSTGITAPAAAAAKGPIRRAPAPDRPEPGSPPGAPLSFAPQTR